MSADPKGPDPKADDVAGGPHLIVPSPTFQLDEDRLAAYLRDHVPGLNRFSVRQFQGGQSNPTYLLDAGDAGRFVLRKKPPGRLLPSAHQVEREYRVISALHGTDVPVPTPITLCEDADVIGTPFYVMGYVPGRVHDHPRVDGVDPAERAALHDSMNATLAALHRVDWAAVGLTGFGKTENYLGRQIDRWARQYRASIVDEADPVMEELMVWLEGNIPADTRTTIAHGDFRIGNLMYAPDAPRVAAVLDWELCTLGDPLGDLAYCCLPYHLPVEGEGGGKGLVGLDLKSLGIPSEAAFLDAYQERVGCAVGSGWTFYLTFALFRLASILQGVYARAVQGNASDANALAVGKRAATLAHAARTLANGEG